MGIGTLSEKSLHAALKERFARPGDLLEDKVDGYVVDIVRDGRLIEIQTGGFSGFKAKLANLLPRHPVHIIYPVVAKRECVRLRADGSVAGRRRSPKRRGVLDGLGELAPISPLLMDPNLTVEIVLVREELATVDDGLGSWRRRGVSVADRKLLGVEGSIVLASLADYRRLLPRGLHESFTVRELADAAKCPVAVAGKAAYALRRAGVIRVAGKRVNALVYEIVP
ncbi:MAG: hypothetical protein V1934_01420 [Methanobacteriota archaeon]